MQVNDIISMSLTLKITKLLTEYLHNILDTVSNFCQTVTLMFVYDLGIHRDNQGGLQQRGDEIYQ